LPEDPKWELAILATVQSFYEKMLQEFVRGDVPIPSGLEAISPHADGTDVQNTLLRMRRWLRLLDLAITPAMLRRAFTPETDAEIAEAVLRYLVRKKEPGEANRDKTDLVTTFLYRHPRVPGQWEHRGYGLDGSLPLSPFEIALLEILADTDVPTLPEEHLQLLRRFDPLWEEASRFRDFNGLMDSGIIQRVREIKQALDTSFCHPGVLATIASYNAAFGAKFNELFKAAAEEIKNFAEALEEQGGSILGNVDGVDVTVEHVAAMNQMDLLKFDYTGALEKFQKVSKLKKVLDRRPPVRRSLRSKPAMPAPVRSGSHPVTSGGAAAAPARTRKVVLPSVTPQQMASEESKLRRIEESIRVFVRVADPKFRQVVPMRFFNLTLSEQEVEAHCAEYLEEKSPRADATRILLRLVAVGARMSTELEELKRAQNSPSLWKLHADALVVLLEVGRTVTEIANRATLLLEREEAMFPQVLAIRESLQKLRERSDTVVKTLAHDVEADSRQVALSQ
jgi:hypothetical protein